MQQEHGIVEYCGKLWKIGGQENKIKLTGIPIMGNRNLVNHVSVLKILLGPGKNLTTDLSKQQLVLHWVNTYMENMTSFSTY